MIVIKKFEKGADPFFAFFSSCNPFKKIQCPKLKQSTPYSAWYLCMLVHSANVFVY
jgi:hypothetical protein